nr:ATP-dependent helicase [Roseicella aerolata]
MDFEVVWVKPGDPRLHGARALVDAQAGCIRCGDTGSRGDRALLLAHEVGHEAVHRLSSGGEAATGSRSPSAAMSRVTDYGPRERRELEAEVFAREFLLPSPDARRLHLDEGRSAAAIEALLGLPRGVVERQLLDALLLPVVGAPVAVAAIGGGAAPGSDPSQDAAASHGGGALLLQAGPGTGKTRTLVSRVRHLVAGGHDPAGILALTFSNRAASEAAERICAHLPDHGPRVWTGTFHQFGMDVIRRHHDRLGLPEKPVLFDGAAAVEALEDLLPTLGLVHHRNLWEPALLLKEILRAISRAKDELVGPERYAELAAGMLAAAGDPDGIEAAERAVEVARVYDAYQRELRARGAVDFGDQVMLPALLLEADAEVATALRSRHRHVLVDEYQDVNRASIRLLKALVGTGGDVWVVGDPRQAIYRFRGASAASVARFGEDFGPFAAMRLDTNYRSSAEVVGTFLGFGHNMAAAAGTPALSLSPKRGATGAGPELITCADDREELGAVVAGIESLVSSGIGYGQQAVLCRGNSKMDQVAEALEVAGIPVLRLGNLFERDEVRDLLSLLSLAADSTGTGLPRVGAFPRYGLTLQDVRVAASALDPGTGRTVVEALGQLATEGLSALARAGLDRLRHDLAGLGPGSSPWTFLTTYLLDRTRWLADLASAPGVAGRMRCLAIWSLMEFVREQPPGIGGPPIRRLLERVRRVTMLGEARSLGDVPEAARGLDAVRVMTVHGSKGLEFEAVHLPGLHDRGFPLSYRAPTCPPPDGLIDDPGAPGSSPEADALAEEECLFFVALSRARTHLRLYRTRATGGARRQTRKPSPFLARVAPFLTEREGVAVAVAPQVGEPPIAVAWPGGIPVVEAHHLDLYRRCPRRFLHTVLLGIRGARKTGPFARTHDCASRLLARLGAPTEGPAGSDLTDLEAEFERIWLEHGPHDHGFAPDYRTLGAALVRAVHAQLGGRARFEPTTHLVALPGGCVVVRSDDSRAAADGTRVFRRIKTGTDRGARGVEDDVAFILLHMAARDCATGGYKVEAAHLTDQEVRPVDLTPVKLRNREDTVLRLVDGLCAGNFPARIDDAACPRCPHWFACGRLPPGGLKVEPTGAAAA